MSGGTGQELLVLETVVQCLSQNVSCLLLLPRSLRPIVENTLNRTLKHIEGAPVSPPLNEHEVSALGKLPTTLNFQDFGRTSVKYFEEGRAEMLEFCCAFHCLPVEFQPKRVCVVSPELFPLDGISLNSVLCLIGAIACVTVHFTPGPCDPVYAEVLRRFSSPLLSPTK